MKKIEALIRPSDLETVKEELDEAGIRNVIASEALCLGEPSHERRVYRGSVYIVDAAPCTRLSVIVADELLGQAVEILRPAAEHGPVLDDAIIVMNVEAVPSRDGMADRPERMPSTQMAAVRSSESRGAPSAHSSRSGVLQGHARIAHKPTLA